MSDSIKIAVNNLILNLQANASPVEEDRESARKYFTQIFCLPKTFYLILYILTNPQAYAGEIQNQVVGTLLEFVKKQETMFPEAKSFLITDVIPNVHKLLIQMHPLHQYIGHKVYLRLVKSTGSDDPFLLKEESLQLLASSKNFKEIQKRITLQTIIKTYFVELNDPNASYEYLVQFFEMISSFFTPENLDDTDFFKIFEHIFNVIHSLCKKNEYCFQAIIQNQTTLKIACKIVNVIEEYGKENQIIANHEFLSLIQISVKFISLFVDAFLNDDSVPDVDVLINISFSACYYGRISIPHDIISQSMLAKILIYSLPKKDIDQNVFDMLFEIACSYVQLRQIDNMNFEVNPNLFYEVALENTSIIKMDLRSSSICIIDELVKRDINYLLQLISHSPYTEGLMRFIAHIAQFAETSEQKASILQYVYDVKQNITSDIENASYFYMLLSSFDLLPSSDYKAVQSSATELVNSENCVFSTLGYELTFKLANHGINYSIEEQSFLINNSPKCLTKAYLSCLAEIFDRYNNKTPEYVQQMINICLQIFNNEKLEENSDQYNQTLESSTTFLVHIIEKNPECCQFSSIYRFIHDQIEKDFCSIMYIKDLIISIALSETQQAKEVIMFILDEFDPHYYSYFKEISEIFLSIIYKKENLYTQLQLDQILFDKCMESLNFIQEDNVIDDEDIVYIGDLLAALIQLKNIDPSPAIQYSIGISQEAITENMYLRSFCFNVLSAFYLMNPIPIDDGLFKFMQDYLASPHINRPSDRYLLFLALCSVALNKDNKEDLILEINASYSQPVPKSDLKTCLYPPPIPAIDRYIKGYCETENAS